MPERKASVCFDRGGRLGEQSRHLVGVFEVAFGVGERELARPLQRDPLADAGDDVGERPALGRMHQRIVGRNQRRADFARQQDALGERATHRFAIDEARADPKFCAKGFAQLLEFHALVLRGAGHCDGAQVFSRFERVGKIKVTLALFGAQISFGEELAQAPVAGAIFRIDDQIGRAVAKRQPRADNDAHRAHRSAVFSRENMGANNPRQGVAIGYAEPGEPDFRRARDHFFRVRSAAQKREIGHRRQLGEARGEADHGTLLPLAG